MSYFYTTPYSVVLGNNLKKYTRVTPNRCARMCLEEDSFVCKSFDYQVSVRLPSGYLCAVADFSTNVITIYIYTTFTLYIIIVTIERPCSRVGLCT